jgi:hypothetical protein
MEHLNKMNRLNKHIALLSGPMDEVSDNGAGWRSMLTPILHQIGIGVFNPCDKPTNEGDESPEVKAEWAYLKENGRWDEYRTLIKPIIGVDLRMVDKSDFIILYINKEVHMCGSYHESAWAFLERKPVLVVCEQGKVNCPMFIFGLTPHEQIFDNFADMLLYLTKVANGTIEPDKKRWRFFDYDKVFGVK